MKSRNLPIPLTETLILGASRLKGKVPAGWCSLTGPSSSLSEGLRVLTSPVLFSKQDENET